MVQDRMFLDHLIPQLGTSAYPHGKALHTMLAQNIFTDEKHQEKFLSFHPSPIEKFGIFRGGLATFFFTLSDFLSIPLQCCSPFPQFRTHFMQSVVIGQLVLSFEAFIISLLCHTRAGISEARRRSDILISLICMTSKEEHKLNVQIIDLHKLKIHHFIYHCHYEKKCLKTADISQGFCFYLCVLTCQVVFFFVFTMLDDL